MAQVIYGNRSTVDALVRGVDTHPGTVAFLQNQIAQFSSAIGNASHAFVAKAREMYDAYNGEQYMRTARAAIHKYGNLLKVDAIRPLYTLPEVQNAPISMQRYLMANPVVRQLYNQQRIDGYSDTYRDMHPGTIGDNHYDYRRVMEGIVHIPEGAGSEDEFVYKCYGDDLLPGDHDLTLSDQVTILSVWDLMNGHVAVGKNDCTSVWDADM